jgi:hypothetical protein
MQDMEGAQEPEVAHCGAASPGVTQRPVAQTVAAPQLQQSALDAHSVRHTAFTQIWPPEQSLLASHAGLGRSSA